LYRGQIADLNRQLEELRAKMGTDIRLEPSALNVTISRERDTTMRAEAGIQGIRDEMNRWQQKQGALALEIDRALKSLVSLKEEYDLLTRRIAEIERERQSELERLRREVEDGKNESNQIDNALRDYAQNLPAELERLRNMVRENEARIAAAKGENDRLRRGVAERQQDLKALIDRQSDMPNRFQQDKDRMIREYDMQIQNAPVIPFYAVTCGLTMV
jgi:chromosome segregation ATPase